jgi:hypothetical protein
MESVFDGTSINTPRKTPRWAGVPSKRSFPGWIGTPTIRKKKSATSRAQTAREGEGARIIKSST